MIVRRKAVYVCRLPKEHARLTLRAERQEPKEVWVAYMKDEGKLSSRAKRLRALGKNPPQLKEWKKETRLFPVRAIEFGHRYYFNRYE